MGSLYDWAKGEVAIACKRENPDWKEGDFDYGCNIYQSALKAFKSLTEDGHTNNSIVFTQRILNRLIDGKCLTPIEDTDDVWDSSRIDIQENYTCYQCNRMSSLFKYVYDDGHIEYHDVERTVKIDQNGMAWNSGLTSRLVNELYPISMPYYPPSEPYRVYVEDFLYDKNNGDYDTVGIVYLTTPEGERVDIGRYEAEKDGKFVPISESEYNERKAHSINAGTFKNE